MQASYNHQNAYRYQQQQQQQQRWQQQQQQQQGFNPNHGHEDQENHMLLNEFEVLLEDAEPVVEKLALVAQERQSFEIHKRHEDYVPVVQNKIYKLSVNSSRRRQV